MDLNQIENLTPEMLKNRIDMIKLEMEYLKLENEKLRLQNENLRLRSLSRDEVIVSDDTSVDCPSLGSPVDSEENVLLGSIQEAIEEDSDKEPNEEPDEIDTTFLDKFNISNSLITYCNLELNDETVEVDKKDSTYMGILRKIWRVTPRQTVYDNSIFKMKDYYCNKRGFKWIYDIQLSVRITNTKDILHEIITLCNVMNYKLDLKIELRNGNVLEIYLWKHKETNKNTLSYEVINNKTDTSSTVNKCDRLLYNKWGGFYH